MMIQERVLHVDPPMDVHSVIPHIDYKAVRSYEQLMEAYHSRIVTYKAHLVNTHNMSFGRIDNIMTIKEMKRLHRRLHKRMGASDHNADKE